MREIFSKVINMEMADTDGMETIFMKVNSIEINDRD